MSNYQHELILVVVFFLIIDIVLFFIGLFPKSISDVLFSTNIVELFTHVCILIFSFTIGILWISYLQIGEQAGPVVVTRKTVRLMFAFGIVLLSLFGIYNNSLSLLGPLVFGILAVLIGRILFEPSSVKKDNLWNISRLIIGLLTLIIGIAAIIFVIAQFFGFLK